MALPKLSEGQFAMQVFRNPNELTQTVTKALAAGYLVLPEYLIGVVTTDELVPEVDGGNWLDRALQGATNLNVGVTRDGFNSGYVDTPIPLYSVGYNPPSAEWSSREKYFGLYGVNYWYTYFYYTSGGFVATDSRTTIDRVYYIPDHIFLVCQLTTHPDGSNTHKLFLAWQKIDSSGYDIYTISVENDLQIILPADIPPDFGEESKPSDDNGDYDGTSIDIGVPSLPVIDATGSGFINLWKPTIAQVQQIGSILWDDGFVNAIVKSFSSPIDAIVALNIVPSGNAVQTSTSTKRLFLGNYDTGIEMPLVTSQFFEQDMGTLFIKPYWASALDYNPYTTIQLFLPYIGFVDLSPDDVMGKTLHVVYRCEIITGQVLALVFVSSTTGETLLYSHSGNFAMSVPITGANFGELYRTAIQGTLSLASGIAGAVATGGASGVIQGVNALGSATSGAVSGSKVQYERSGSVSMTAAYMGKQSCYVVITRPRQSLAADYNKFVGYPSNITVNLSSMSGFTVVENIHLEGVLATDEEKDEIVQLLQEGVII